MKRVHAATQNKKATQQAAPRRYSNIPLGDLIRAKDHLDFILPDRHLPRNCRKIAS
jgi:hypothetical protein